MIGPHVDAPLEAIRLSDILQDDEVILPDLIEPEKQVVKVRRGSAAVEEVEFDIEETQAPEVN